MVSGPEALVDGFMPQASGKGQRGPQGKDAAAATTAATPTPKQAAGGRIRERKFENGDRYRGGWLNGLVSSVMQSPLSAVLQELRHRPASLATPVTWSCREAAGVCVHMLITCLPALTLLLCAALAVCRTARRRGQVRVE